MPNPDRRRVLPLTIAAAITAGVAMVILQQAGQIGRGRNPLTGLRTNFWYDQLGYLAISADVANGHFDSTEPVSMTGVSHYPRFYYSLVGVVARVFGLPTVTAWNLTSFVLQIAAVTAIGITAALLARRWWVALLAPLPFFTGTFAYIQQADSWYTVLQAHAVLWGPYGALFSNNGETAGLCIGLISVSGLIWAWSGQRRTRTRVIVTLIAAALVGMLSSFQTYSFLTFTYLLAYGAAIAAIVFVRARRKTTIVAAVVMLAVVFIAGPLVADRFGQLPTLMFGLLPAFPGLVSAIVRTRGLVALAGTVAVLTAAPQVLFTLGGMVSGDPFLTYRVASNHQLGVVSWQALLSATPVLIPLILTLILAFRLRDRLTITLATTALFVLPFLSVNDIWGANAEPYRFWIEGLLVGGVFALFGLARLSTRVARADAEAADRAKNAPEKTLLVAAVVLSIVAWGASVPDWVNSVRDGTMQASWNPSTERESAIAAMAREGSLDASTGLLVTERCVDNRTAKVTSGSPFAYYHLGMAWPADKDDIDDIISARDAGTLDFEAMESSDTRFVLTDSNCATDWEALYADRFERVSSADYRLSDGEVLLDGAQGDGRITLWRVAD
ncbi:hypothetical protein ACIPJ1_04875 [Microbacterium maritypicum]|uniref:hypothetical protein n=1 Tax=Microbacterium maritypicum TaxID=33918 RepID=UPI00380FE447